MAEPHWTAYVGIVTGAIGAVTGIAGAIMGFIGYRRSTAIKALDLRLDLRKGIAKVQSELLGLEALLDHANQSRQRVAAARGYLKSGVMEIWNKRFEEDKAKARRLVESGPQDEANFNDLAPADLEAKLVSLHKLSIEIENLSNKYRKSLQADDEERKEIREDSRIRVTGS